MRHALFTLPPCSPSSPHKDTHTLLSLGATWQVLIGGKLLLGQAGVEVPLGLIVGVMTAWRVAVAAYVVFGAVRGARAQAVADGEDAGEVEQAVEPAASPLLKSTC